MSIEQWSDLMFPEREGTVTPIYGSVRAINDDGSYEVQLNASSVTTRCAPCCTAMVGDRVLVLIKPNGKCDAIGRLGGDLGGGGTIVTQVDDVSNYIAGRVFAYAGTDEPIGALLCDGRAVSRTTYWELFAAIGTTYGAGDGSTTFNLPNIESRTIIGESDSYALGATGGEEKHTLTVDEMPSHTHEYRTYFGVGPVASEYHCVSYDLDEGSSYYGGNLLPTGGDQPHNNMQPYIVMRYFITTGKGDPVSGINPADYVVEWGTYERWSWRKYASGWAECFTSYEYTIPSNVWAASSRYSGMYYVISSDYRPGGAVYPFEFADVPCETFNFFGESGNVTGEWLYTVDMPNTKKNMGFYLIYRDSVTTAQEMTVRYSVKVEGWLKAPTSGGTETIAPTIERMYKYVEGDTLSGDFAAYGCITGSAKRLELYVPLPKSMEGLDVSITKLSTSIRKPAGGYVSINDSRDFASYVVTAKSFSGGACLFLSLGDDVTALSDVNNIPVSGTISITASFG